jgi:hypothetical protein
LRGGSGAHCGTGKADARVPVDAFGELLQLLVAQRGVGKVQLCVGGIVALHILRPFASHHEHWGNGGGEEAREVGSRV